MINFIYVGDDLWESIMLSLFSGDHIAIFFFVIITVLVSSLTIIIMLCLCWSSVWKNMIWKVCEPNLFLLLLSVSWYLPHGNDQLSWWNHPPSGQKNHLVGEIMRMQLGREVKHGIRRLIQFLSPVRAHLLAMIIWSISVSCMGHKNWPASNCV